jgi:SAM-dependent methyltransferase
MIIKELERKFRRLADVSASKRISKSFEFTTSLDIGCGESGLGRILGSVLGDYNPVAPDVSKVDIYNIPYQDKFFDLIICSNVLEHLNEPLKALIELRRVGQQLWLSWTPWRSPYGGHEFSPFHFFGKTSGSIHTLGINLFKTSTKDTLVLLEQSNWNIMKVRSRYFPWTTGNDFLDWNVEVHAK